jgi:hypothetical protein
MRCHPVHNPLTVQFWLWGQDVLAGYLEAFGFQKRPNPLGKGSSIYHKDGVGLHSNALWQQTPQGVLVYLRPAEGFFLLEGDSSLPALPDRAKPVDCAYGLEAVRPFVQAYEAWIVQQAGPAYRSGLLSNLPPAARRARVAWQVWIAIEPRAQLCSTLQVRVG